MKIIKTYQLQWLYVFLACVSLNHCASSATVPVKENKHNKVVIPKKTNTTPQGPSEQENNTLELVVKKEEHTKDDRIEVVLNLEKAEDVSSYAIYVRWDKEALLAEGEDINSLNWEDAEKGQSGMILKLNRSPQKDYQAHIYVKVEDNNKKAIINQTFTTHVPALEKAVVSQHEVLQGSEVLCTYAKDNRVVAITFNAENQAIIANYTVDDGQTWQALFLTDPEDSNTDKAIYENCHLTMLGDELICLSDHTFFSDNAMSNRIYMFNIVEKPECSDQYNCFRPLLSDEKYIDLMDQYGLQDLNIDDERLYIALSNGEDNTILFVKHENNLSGIDQRQSSNFNIAYIPAFQAVLPKADVEDIYSFWFVTQAKQAYEGRISADSLDWDPEAIDAIDIFYLENKRDQRPQVIAYDNDTKTLSSYQFLDVGDFDYPDQKWLDLKQYKFEQIQNIEQIHGVDGHKSRYLLQTNNQVHVFDALNKIHSVFTLIGTS